MARTTQRTALPQPRAVTAVTRRNAVHCTQRHVTRPITARRQITGRWDCAGVIQLLEYATLLEDMRTLAVVCWDRLRGENGLA
jgi:hypothetical protein